MSLVSDNSKTDSSFASVLSRVIQPLKNGVNRRGIGGLRGSSRSFFLSSLWREHTQCLLVITPTLQDAEDCYQELLFFVGKHERAVSPNTGQKFIFLYPPDEEFPFDHASRHPEITSRKIEVLHHLTGSDQPPIIVAPITALLRKSIPRAVLARYSRQVQVGTEVDREELSALLVKSGYLKVGIVEDRGDFSIRGGIVDVFSPGYPAPLRIELYGDTVESIRHFDVALQKSCGERSDAWIVPVSEAIFEEDTLDQIIERTRSQFGQGLFPQESREDLLRTFSTFQVNAEIERLLPYLYPDVDTLFDYLPGDCLIVLHNHEEIKREQETFLLTATERYERCLERNTFVPPVPDFYLSAEETNSRLATFQKLYCDEMGFALPEQETAFFKTYANDDIRKELIDFTSSQGMLAPLADHLKEWQDEAYTILFICHSLNEAHKLIELLEEYGIPVHLLEGEQFDRNESSSSRNGVLIQVASFKKGFRFPLGRLIIITEEELFGEKKRRALPPRIKSGYFVSDFSELKVGDCVVHIDHGVGVYQGLQRLKVGDLSSDCLLIEYFGKDKLYVPVDRIKMVQKYVGTEGSVAKVDRLGGTAWKKTKKKVKTSMRAMAKELLAVYASRTVLQGFSFSPVDHYYREFEATFPYEETPDQLDAIEAVMKDMSAAEPMDRLICGDVGYGKTEVAVRASFRAAMDGKQVAILVPTTVLAQQHYQTMSQRLKPYPIEVEMLSRFRSRTEQKNILRKLEEGTIDIIIGTHRLVQKDVHFNNLGLVIIDEEQRFGVAHKERFKKMRKVVDVLTLTATPIPRTLYMSVVGIRDMSVITTPPEDRLAIKTFINRFNADVIKEAIIRELRRGGQVFFVHDRVHSIRAMARFLSDLVPEAQLAVAHGQMSEKELERVMLSFISKEVNLLVSTTIIESGLDFPSANTIIINRADRMGLAQLYQLRGRVGRSKYRAYCYLFTPGESVLSKDAHDRLKAIFEFSELGSSLRLASRDLEIRGAGNILGTSQSGHIAAVGMDLYTQLMEETIKELQGEKLIPEIDPEVNLPIPSFIPEEYITDINQRLVFYKRLASCMDDASVAEVHEELGDRFGPLPPTVSNLLSVITLKNFLRPFFITSINYNGREITLTFHHHAEDSLEKILTLIESDPQRFRLSPDLKLSIGYTGGDWKDVVHEVRKLLN